MEDSTKEDCSRLESQTDNVEVKSVSADVCRLSENADITSLQTEKSKDLVQTTTADLCDEPTSIEKSGEITNTGEKDTKAENVDADMKSEQTEDIACSAVPCGTGGDDTSQKDDPFAYLERDTHTTEKYKIEISSLPKYFGINQLKKKLNAVGLKPGKVKARQNMPFAFVNFRCEEDRTQALEVLQGLSWKGKSLQVKKANPAADPLVKKRKQESERKDGHADKKAKVEESATETDNTPLSERLNSAVIPLWQLPYEEQLEKKEEVVKSYMKKLSQQIHRNNDDHGLRKWYGQQEKENVGICCKLHPVKSSPIVQGYRNKSEFTIGQDADGKDKTIGFRLSSYKGGVVTVVEPTECLHVPQLAQQVVKCFQKYLQTQSTYSGYFPEDRSGHWRTAAVRNNSKNHVMLIAVFHPQELAKDEIAAEKQKLLEYFASGDGKEINLNSLYFLLETDRRDLNVQFQYEHLYGEKHLQEDLLGLTFRVSPGAFFQVNTPAAEILYSTVADWCQISSETVLLDICCGTGTIGLTMAKKVKRVVGIELCKEAVDDAKANAELNGITNTEYHCGRAEDVLPSLIKRYGRYEVVAVVDPPRAGLHADVMRAIRKSTYVKRLLYVSCKPTGAMNNLVDLTRSESRRVKGSPFKLVRAIPVDMFPYLDHSELILELERVKDPHSDDLT